MFPCFLQSIVCRHSSNGTCFNGSYEALYDISLPFISAQRFKLKTKVQPFDVPLFTLIFCSQDAILIFDNVLIAFCKFWGPYWVPNPFQILTQSQILINFRNPDFSSLEALQVPLESRLEPLMLVLRAPKTRKVFLFNGKSHFLQMLFSVL